MMMVPAFRHMLSSVFSSASTPTARTTASARILASDLAISRQIIEAHGGHIHATNRTAAPTGNGLEGEILGARFIVWLPIAR